LEFKVNYVPLFEKKEVKEFAVRFNLAERFVVVDREGRPAARVLGIADKETLRALITSVIEEGAAD
jgi:hypothetical protein